jgi:2-haloalkanoic acid dehalogenase type II
LQTLDDSRKYFLLSEVTSDMAELSEYRLLSFDVYGTLVDWEGGILEVFQPIFHRNNRKDITREHLLQTFEKCEREQQSKTPDMLYTQVLSTVHPRIAAALGLEEPTAEESKAFSESIGRWPAFPDTVDALRRLSKHYKLVVLSNVDRESFSATNAGSLQGIKFDKIITAQDIGSYKPDQRNFGYMLEQVKADFGIEKEEVLQTAQSQFHDHEPASKIGIKSVWIARSGASMGIAAKEIYDWKFDTLGEMADALEKEIA